MSRQLVRRVQEGMLQKRRPHRNSYSKLLATNLQANPGPCRKRGEKKHYSMTWGRIWPSITPEVFIDQGFATPQEQALFSAVCFARENPFRRHAARVALWEADRLEVEVRGHLEEGAGGENHDLSFVARTGPANAPSSFAEENLCLCVRLPEKRKNHVQAEPTA